MAIAIASQKKAWLILKELQKSGKIEIVAYQRVPAVMPFCDGTLRGHIPGLQIILIPEDAA